MSKEAAAQYDPQAIEADTAEIWARAGAFDADPADPREAYCIVLPPPNVTAALHLGHALNGTLQDILIRHRRMRQCNTLWVPGTDHAGIATQTVVEKRILAEEGRKRTDFQREEFVERVQAWKDANGARILEQLQRMGCSCDWRRTRFTMDEMCAKAVRENFFRLFADGLIYRGKRLVNWDPATQTVLADDEVEHEDVHGHFWYMRYPLVEPVEIPRGTGVPPVRPTDVPSVAEEQLCKRDGAYLSHWTRPGGKYAVTFRLADAVPAQVLENWRRERDDIAQRAMNQGRELTRGEQRELERLYSDRIQAYLDAGHGSCCLEDARIADLVLNAMEHFDQERYELVAWCVMPNHVHVVVTPFEDHGLPAILHSWKSYTAKEANRVLGRHGQFWQEEYYDHLIRDEDDFIHSINYLLGNPSNAGLKNRRWCGSKTSANHGRDGHETHGQDARATVITHVTVATTRPETMLGDTAVAMNPSDPRAAYLVGKGVRLPLVGRVIPIIADDHVVLPDPESDDEKARFSTGFLKVTPAHDPDDYQIGQRHGLPLINVMAPDASISDRYGWDDATGTDAEQFLGMDRFEARAGIVEWFRTEGLLEEVREYIHQVGHSYRSHVPIEPYLSDQWYVAVKKPIDHLAEQFGTGPIAGTDVPVNSLAGLALKPLLDGRLKFTPERYARTYQLWLENLRDWPISRQLWWGHQIPVWSKIEDVSAVDEPQGPFPFSVAGIEAQTYTRPNEDGETQSIFVCLPQEYGDADVQLEADGFVRDDDVLDTWFSSALWPFSTLGWPGKTPEIETFYPGHVLCTAREIITLWVSRMVMMGQYCLGDIPFADVFIHAMIQDGEGRKMSKSLGNGIDPLDIISSHGADAMRFTLAAMTTQTQDVRMPVEAMDLPDGRTANTSPKFDLGRNFCNKLWNASRFVLMNIERAPAWAQIRPKAHLADAWILSRLNGCIREATASIENFRFNELADTLYHFTWDDFCDWYVEIAKARIGDGDEAPRAILAHCIDTILRLLHPVTPFITEAIWQRLGEVAPIRGPGDEHAEEMLVTARWPRADAAAINTTAERDFDLMRALIRSVRDARRQHNVAPSVTPEATLVAVGDQCQAVLDNAEMLRSQARLGQLTVHRQGVEPPPNSAAVAIAGVELYIHDIVDVEAERARLTRQANELTRGISGIEGKLDNSGFLKKAPPEIVSRERERLGALVADLEAVRKSLAALG